MSLAQAPAQCRGWYGSRPDVTGPCWTQTSGTAVLQARLEGRHTGATGGGEPAGVSRPDSVSPSSWLERWWGPGAPRLPSVEFWWSCHPRVAKGPLPFASHMGAGVCGGGGALDPRSPQHGQPWAGEGCGQEGEGLDYQEGRAALGSPGESPKSEDLQSLWGLRVRGGGARTSISTLGLAERLPQLDQRGTETPRWSSPPAACCLLRSQLVKSACCALRGPVTLSSTRTRALLSGSGSLEPHAQQILGRAWLGPFWPERRGTSG